MFYEIIRYPTIKTCLVIRDLEYLPRGSGTGNEKSDFEDPYQLLSVNGTNHRRLEKNKQNLYQ
jgi:hypothetical protein